MRVAVCISGQMRTYRRAYLSLMEYLVGPHSADVFVDTWNKSGNTNKIVLFLPKYFSVSLPRPYHHAEPDLLSNEKSLFESSFPVLFSELQKIASADDTVTMDEINDLYSPTNVRIEEFSQRIFSKFDIETAAKLFPDRTALNAIPMFYKIFQCDQLRIQHEKKSGLRYDIVIRTRPDLLFSDTVKFERNQFSGRLATLHNPFYDILGVTDVTSNDMFFVGDSKTMEYASGIWHELPKYWNPSYEPSRPFSDRGPERILHDHLKEGGLSNNVLQLSPPPQRIAPSIDFHKLLNCLRADFESRGGLPMFVRDCVAMAQCAFAVDTFVVGNTEEALSYIREPISIGSFVCEEPYAARAKIASLQGDDVAVTHWANLARAAGQERLYPELFTT